TEERDIAWSPDGRRIAFVANRRRDHDLHQRSNVYVVDVESGRVTAVTEGDDGMFMAPAWSADGSAIVAIGGRFPRAGYRNGIWRFAADGSESKAGTDLLAGSDLMPASSMNSDVVVGAMPRLAVSTDGQVRFSAPIDGSYELWEVPLDGGEIGRLTGDRHYLSWWDVSVDGAAFAVVRASATSFPDVHVARLDDAPGSAPASARLAFQRVGTLNDQLASEVSWVEPIERRWQSDGREIQGWLFPAGDGARPLVLEIHGGPHTLYGWSPMWEWQVLAGAGISVLASNPRGSEGYGEAFNRANLGDWGDGPMADVMAGIDAAIADGFADPDRLGVTGGSYGGYLTNWIIGRTQRFRAAITCRSVSDMYALFLTGDISGGEWAEIEFGRLPWDDPGYFQSISPLALAREVRTPLLIQHAEQDLRCVVTQAEALFTVLRSLKRPVRFMRVPEESHELTRSGTPFRRVENLVQVRDWFAHYLVKGARTLPPLPKARAGK
ncbi:MAG TPA: S9 family peptidase, partial [Candidatus Limnocylindrales bacterium]|nr:S9 family peptidase [Candidatus Limnocylindrales bacterium]